MKNFDYIRPVNMDNAVEALKKNDDAYLLAGGTDLLIGMKNNAVQPKCLIDLKSIPDIDSIEYRNGFKLGPLTTIRDIEVSRSIRKKIPVLSQAAGTLGSIQIRNRATIGGNLCHASPAADMATILLAMDCHVKIASYKSEKTIGLDQFYTGPNRTVIGRGEMLSEIIIPKDMERFKGVYLKYGPRKAMDIGIVNIALLLDADYERGLCNQIMIALGAVAPTPIRAKGAEALLNGNRLKAGSIGKVAQAAADEARPISDFRASAGYRRDLVRSLVFKGINQILKDNNPS
ncbi:MAG TPA: xanthine dehydrogenase family protein subunit M [Desulfobacterales bacterium]|nr:xanthine dehydrogenase family protein subunit M [Desulfobacterales bacterium]